MAHCVVTTGKRVFKILEGFVTVQCFTMFPPFFRLFGYGIGSVFLARLTDRPVGLQAGDLPKTVGKVGEPVLTIGFKKPVRCRIRKVAEARLADAQRSLGAGAAGDVKVGRDKAAVRCRAADDFDGAAIRSDTLETVGLCLASELDARADLFFDVAGAVFAAFGIVANECFKGVSGCGKFNRKMHDVEELTVAELHLQLLVDQRDADRDIVND